MRVALVLLALAAIALGEAAPDQVLVLYNADWTEDLDGSEPGQDSLEVARYYVAQHTDPKTGKKPYLLGLSCKHGNEKHLNQMRLPERSNDNWDGMRFVGKGPAPKDTPWSATHIVAFGPEEVKQLDPASLTIRASATEAEADAKVIYANGRPAEGFDVREVKEGSVLTAYSLASRQAFPDGFTAWVEAKTKDGRGCRKYQARFYYPDQFEADPTGPDGVRDDANYLDDIQKPIKALLEDPSNFLPDGTPLRNHILYIVACYGLPKQVECSYGIIRGVLTEHRPDLGDGSSLEQRLAVMYYDLSHRFRVALLPMLGGASHILIANGLRPSLGGDNPYRHPMTHTPRNQPPNETRLRQPLYPSYDYGARRIPHFTPETRRQLGERFLYFAMRVDGRHPEIAKAQIDGALYGTRHLTPDLGWFWHGTHGAAPSGALELKYFEFRDKPGPSDVGRCLFYFGDLSWGTLYPDDPAKPPVPYWRGFYPGSVAYAVRSHVGWQFANGISQLYDGNSHYFERMVEAGATVCAGSAHGAHDTSATWWDDQVLFHHLLRGYDLGESLLMSSVYLDWTLSYVGDPLYRPDLRLTVRDETPPKVAAPADIAVEANPADGRYWARLRPKLATAPDNPEMTDIAVTYWRSPDAKQTASDWRFTRRPAVLLPDLEPDATYHYDLVLTDPYGNAFSSAKAFGDLTLKTGPPPPAKRVLAEFRGGATAKAFASLEIRPDDPDPAKRKLLPERGEIHVEFTPQKPWFDLLTVDRREFVVTPSGFGVGGRAAAFCSPPGEKPPPVFQPARRYRMILRWRRDPVVRQAVLVARDGREFLLGSSNRLSWLSYHVGAHLLSATDACTIHSLAVYDDTRPQPLDPLYPGHFDLAGFEAADAEKR